eukprot:Gb_31486 [translate_table: standard]
MMTLYSTQPCSLVQTQQSKLKERLCRYSHGPSVVYLQRLRSTKGPNKDQPRFKIVQCRSEMSHDAPIAIAIGTCVLNSIVFPVRDNKNGEEGQSLEDVRYAAMGIISFIPFFNWLILTYDFIRIKLVASRDASGRMSLMLDSWVFAWLDTGRQRYLVYAIVYLAPYVRQVLCSF